MHHDLLELSPRRRLQGAVCSVGLAIVVAGACIIGAGSTVLANDGQQAGNKAAAENPASPTLSQVDRIQIRVPHFQDVSGEYSINPDNTLSITGIGRINVDALTTEEIEKLLSRRFGRIARSEIDVSIDIVRYRPFYIAGQIARPGAFDWRPGLNLIQAIAVAGGVSRGGAEPTGSAPERELIRMQTHMQLGVALVQLARHIAEKTGKHSIASTGVLDRFMKNAPRRVVSAIRTFIDRQNEILRRQQKLIATEVSDLKRATQAAERNLVFALEREAAIVKQVEVARSQSAIVEKLKKSKLVTNTRYLAVKSELISQEISHGEVRLRVAQAREQLAEARRRMKDTVQRRKLALDQQIERAEIDIARHSLALGNASALHSSDYLPKPDPLEYFIARMTPHGMRTVPATLFTRVLPGDSIIISTGPPESVSRSVGVVAQSSGRGAGQLMNQTGSERNLQLMLERSASTVGRRTVTDTASQRPLPQ